MPNGSADESEVLVPEVEQMPGGDPRGFDVVEKHRTGAALQTGVEQYDGYVDVQGRCQHAVREVLPPLEDHPIDPALPYERVQLALSRPRAIELSQQHADGS